MDAAPLLDVRNLVVAYRAGRYRHELSGGQCQCICIARAPAAEPELLICGEAVSALDVSIRAQILNLLEEMKARYRLTLLFIAHDLAAVKAVSDRVAVMYLGRLCEIGPTEALYRTPAHRCTATLLAAIPVPDPDAAAPESVPELRDVAPDRQVACHHPLL
jgi:peptide/nickel transport system ATP-binding protein